MLDTQCTLLSYDEISTLLQAYGDIIAQHRNKKNQMYEKICQDCPYFTPIDSILLCTFTSRLCWYFHALMHRNQNLTLISIPWFTLCLLLEVSSLWLITASRLSHDWDFYLWRKKYVSSSTDELVNGASSQGGFQIGIMKSKT